MFHGVTVKWNNLPIPVMSLWCVSDFTLAANATILPLMRGGIDNL